MQNSHIILQKLWEEEMKVQNDKKNVKDEDIRGGNERNRKREF